MNELKSVCWNITTKCNEKCKFCYRIKDCRDSSYDENLKIIENIIKSKVEKISICGGEPLVYPDLMNIIKKIKKLNKNIIISLTTNGILLTNEKIEELSSYIDWISLDLDSTSQEIQSKITRNKHHIENVMRIINYVEDNKTNINIKINTVVSKFNLNEILEIAEFVNRHYVVKRWKLMKFHPVRGDALKNKEIFDITNIQFLKATSVLKNFKSEKCKISISDQESMKNSYFSIYPDGNVRLEENGVEKIVGNAMNCNLNEIFSTHKYRKDLQNSRFDDAIKEK